MIDSQGRQRALGFDGFLQRRRDADEKIPGIDGDVTEMAGDVTFAMQWGRDCDDWGRATALAS
eukprot:2301929-Rhodomonas_salina.4